MEITADFICYQYFGGERDYTAHMRRLHPWAWECRCPRTVECEWTGDEHGVALLGGDVIFSQLSKGESPIGKIINFGGFKLRVIEMMVTDYGAYCDRFYVMLADNPNGELRVLYRRAARALIRFTLNIEARIHGLLLKPFEGRVMPFTNWLGGKLL